MDVMEKRAQTITDEHGQTPTMVENEKGHRVFWFRQTWRMRLARRLGMTLQEQRVVVFNAARDQGYRVILFAGGSGWDVWAEIEGRRFVDREILIKRLAGALMTEGVDLLDMEIEGKGGEWRKEKDEQTNIEHRFLNEEVI